MDHDLIVALKALTDPTRLQIVGRLAAGPTTAAALAAELRLAPGVVRHHVTRLLGAGLVERAGPDVDGRYAIRVEALDQLGRRLAELEAGEASSPGPGIGPGGEAVDPDAARVLRGYFDGERLVTIPAQHAKRLVVLRYLRDRCFGEDRAYPEKEVNQRLALFHPDVAALRRSMVDDGLMTRADGVYRRPPEPGSGS